MALDPFKNASIDGYLMNHHRLPPGPLLKALEHQSFHHHLPETLAWLGRQKSIGYAHLLETHGRLFRDVYPWAGQDRRITLPDRTVRKGATLFADPSDIQAAFEAGNRAKTIGKTLGYWAYAHPFMDGNGRALFTLVTDRLFRQEKALDWPALDVHTFLQTLDIQIDQPEGNAMDLLLAPHLGSFRS